MTREGRDNPSSREDSRRALLDAWPYYCAAVLFVIVLALFLK